jgi:hypothetical protein
MPHQERIIYFKIRVLYAVLKQLLGKYEIAESIARKNGLLGIYIHHLKDRDGNTSLFRGSKPAVAAGIEFPAYDWDKDLGKFRKAIEDTGNLYQVAPISANLILSYVAEPVLGLPRSF